MVDRPPYPIPAEVHPEKYRCIVVPVPDDPTYVQVFAGVISDMTQWFNWARDEGKNGKECAQVWRDIYNEIDWSGNMGKCGCCPPPERKYRWTDDGHYQISDDGGVTWTDDPVADPRYSVPEFPPNPPEGAVLDQCTYADSVVNIYKNQFVEAIEVGDDIQTIIGIIIGIISAVLGTVAAPLVYQIMAVVVGAILAYTIEAFQAAFTTDVWDRLRCNLLENMGTDGSFTQEQVDSIYARIGEEETGIVDFVLKHAVATFGAKGLTNAARSGFGSLTADCASCSDCNEYDFTTSEYGWEIYTIGGTAYGEYIPGTGFRARWFNDPGFSYQMNGVIQKAWTGEGIGIVRVTTNFVSSNPTAEVTVTVEGVNFTETSIPAGLHTTTFNIDTGAVDDIKVTTVFYPSPTGTDYVDIVSIEICPPEV